MANAFINSTNGLFIDRNTFNSMIVKYKKLWHTREKLPPCGALANVRVAKTLQHYAALGNNILISRGHKDLFNITVSFNDVERFAKNTIDSKNFLAIHQKVCLKEIVNIYNQKNYGDVLLAMGTGLGKTRLACFLTSKIGIKTAIVVPTKHIATQWVAELNDMYSDDIHITTYLNKLGEIPKGPIVIIIINTARNKTREFFSQFGLIVFDEIHEYTTNKSKNILWNSSVVRFRLGLTATPEYSGFGLLPYLEGHLGKTLYSESIPGFSSSVKKFNVTVKGIKFCASDTKYAIPVLSKSGTVSIMETLQKILEDPLRTELVVDMIKQLYITGKNILIFAEFREYLDDISKLLGSKHNIVLKGGVDYKTICEASNTRIILTTYAYSRRGINYDQLNTLVLATPRRNGLKQIIGRILRYKSDNTIPRTIIDIIDCNTVVRSQWLDRKKIYNLRDYHIVMV